METKRFTKSSKIRNRAALPVEEKVEPKPLPMKEALRALLQFERASTTQTIYVAGENQAVLSWCVLARKKEGFLRLLLDFKCSTHLVAEVGLMLNVYPEIQLEEQRIWIKDGDFLIGEQALQKYREHLESTNSSPQEPQLPEAAKV
jgi:hypothetical protein